MVSFQRFVHADHCHNIASRERQGGFVQVRPHKGQSEPASGSDFDLGRDDLIADAGHFAG